MDVRILGPLEVWEGSQQLVVDSPRQRLLLALLAINANEVVSVDRIVDELWGESPPASAQSAVRYHISKLRSSLGDAAVHVVTRSPGYVLEVEPDAVDVHRFEVIAAKGRGLIATEPERAARMLVDALAMWRGAPLADFTYESFARGEIVRLEELRLAVLEERIEADLASGRHVDLVGELEALVGEHPLRERLWGQLMTALYRSGRQAEALRAYQEAHRVFGEIGIEPSPELQSMEEQVLLQDPLLIPPRPPTRWHNLPERLSSFIGRGREIDEIQHLIGDHRLVTLTGVGGVGKTSLATEVARTLIGNFADGVWFVATSDVADADFISERLAHVLGVDIQSSEGLVDQLGDYLYEREALLIFDACERHVDAVAKLAEHLLAAAPRLRVLATSREPLLVGGEARFDVPVLDSDGIDAEAVQLFGERAVLVQPEFGTTNDNVDTVTRICRRLAGIPLAIELAAARLGALVLDQVDRRLDDQMALLTRGRRGDASHHNSLEVALDWSHDLLQPAEQLLFRRLTVFQGGFTLEAAEQVCSDETISETVVVDVLTRLANVSLVVADREAARFRMLDPVRQYAERHLESANETELLQQRHASYYRDLAQLAFDGMYGPDEIYWTRVCLVDESNHRAAISWALGSGEARIALDIAAYLGYFWWQAGLSGGADPLFESILASSRDLASKELVLLLEQVSNRELNNDVTAAIRHAEQALDVAQEIGDDFAIGVALDQLGCATWTVDNEKAVEYISKAVDAFHRLDHGRVVYSLHQLAWMLCDQLDETGESLEKATVAAEDAFNRAQRLGFPSGLALASRVLGMVSMYRGEPDRARDHFAEAAEQLRTLERPGSLLGILGNQADNELQCGNIAAADEFATEMETLGRATGTPPDAFDWCLRGRICLGRGDVTDGMRYLQKALVSNNVAGAAEAVAYVLWLLGGGFLLNGEAEIATRVLGAFTTAHHRLKRAFPVPEERQLQQQLSDLRSTLGNDTFDQAWAEGEAMSIDDAVAYAVDALQAEPVP